MRSSVLLVALLAIDAIAQNGTGKRRFEVDWGWNRSMYTRSDIHFTGADHDFVLHDVEARDRPTAVSIDPYLDPLKITVPQTNLTVRYFLDDRYSVALRFDHMKYVMVQDQRVRMDGTITDEASSFAGNYVDASVMVVKDFLAYEHSDGLNFIHGEFARHDKLAGFFGDRVALEVSEGVDAGFLMPRTACRFLGKPLSDKYHVSGYGFGGRAAVAFVFHAVVLQVEGKGGYINLPDVRTSNDRQDKASQHFWFAQANVQVGVRFGLFRKRAAPAE